jgi:Tfp pilus assembly protein PilV
MREKLNQQSYTYSQGFSLLEVLIGVFLFALVSIAIYRGFVTVLMVVKDSEAKTTAMLLANEQIEIIRNLAYKDVGNVKGIPAGLIPRFQTVTRNGMIFNLTTSVRNIDDPFDGQLGSSTKNDTAPADYKQVEIQIGCSNCQNYSTTTIVTTVAPKNLESSSNNGSLFIKVFDSVGQAVPQANVHIDNGSTISIDETTDNDGIFQLVDTPPGNLIYHVTVSKNGYSTASTYPLYGSVVYNPLDPNLTVVSGQVTQKSLAIDRVGEMHFRTIDSSCNPVSDFSFHLRGDKYIGLTSSGSKVYKYDQSLKTDSYGLKNINNLEWDNYSLWGEDATRELAGIMPIAPISLAAGAVQDVSLIVTNKSTNSMLVAVKDKVSGLPVDGAIVNYQNISLTTNRGSFNQTDWSGGAGQSIYTNQTRFFDTDTNIDFSTVPGQIKLYSSLGRYVNNGYLTSSSFDTGATSTVYDSISWLPLSQVSSTGPDSVRFQVATSDDPATTTWDFLGPDGTSATYYTATNTHINSVHSGKRYIRYRLYLSTADVNYSPIISDVAITYSSACTPFGQVLFQNLSTGTSTLTVSRSGYQTYTADIPTVPGWQLTNVLLNPE